MRRYETQYWMWRGGNIYDHDCVAATAREEKSFNEIVYAKKALNLIWAAFFLDACVFCRSDF